MEFGVRLGMIYGQAISASLVREPLLDPTSGWHDPVPNTAYHALDHCLIETSN